MRQIKNSKKIINLATSLMLNQEEIKNISIVKKVYSPQGLLMIKVTKLINIIIIRARFQK